MLLVLIWKLKPRPDERVDAAYLQGMYAYSSSCQLRHFQLRHCIVNDVISTGVAAGADTNILAIYCYYIEKTAYSVSKVI